MAGDFGNVILSSKPKLPIDPERPLGTKFDREFFLSPFSIIIEYCNRSTFHTKHRPEKYAEYFQATKQAFHERHPAMDIIGNPEEHFNGRRAWKVQDELRPLEDVSRPRLGAFEVTLICARIGPRTVFSKLESGCWPNPKALVGRAECVSKFGEPLPPVVGYQDALRYSRHVNNSPLPGLHSLKVKRNLPLYQPRFKRSWNPPAAKPLAKVADLRDLSTQLCRRGGPSPKRSSKQPHDGKMDSTSQDFALGGEDFNEFATAYLQQVFPSGRDDTVEGREEAYEQFEPEAPSTSRPSSHKSRPGSSGRQLIQTSDVAVTESQPDEKDVVREQRSGTYEEFEEDELETQPQKHEEDEFETQQSKTLGDSWSEFEDSRILRDVDGTDEVDPTTDTKPTPPTQLDVQADLQDRGQLRALEEAPKKTEEVVKIEADEEATQKEGRGQLNSQEESQKKTEGVARAEADDEATQKVVVDPTVQNAELEIPLQLVKKTMVVEITRSESQKYGMVLVPHGESECFVKDIRSGGRVEEWNVHHPDEIIQIGDLLVSVNGKNSHREMVDELKHSTTVSIVVAWEEEVQVQPQDDFIARANTPTDVAVDHSSPGVTRGAASNFSPQEEDRAEYQPRNVLPEKPPQDTLSTELEVPPAPVGLTDGMLEPPLPRDENLVQPEALRLAEVDLLSRVQVGPLPPEMAFRAPAPPAPQGEEFAEPHERMRLVEPQAPLAAELETNPPPPQRAFDKPAPPSPNRQDHSEPPREFATLADMDLLSDEDEPMTLLVDNSLRSPSKPSRRPPLPPSTILPPSAPDMMDSGLLGEAEESFMFLQPEACNEDVIFPSPPLPPLPHRTDHGDSDMPSPPRAPQRPEQQGCETKGSQEYDYAADFEDDLDEGQTLTDASRDSIAFVRAETNSLVGDKESITNAESSDDSEPEDSVSVENARARSSHAESLEFVGLANVEDHTSEEDDDIGMVARAIAHGDTAESENSYDSADIVDIGGKDGADYDEDFGEETNQYQLWRPKEQEQYEDDWITPPPPGSSRESKTPGGQSNFLDSDDDEEDMLS